MVERKYRSGHLGDRNKCNLTGSKDNQKSKGHTYKVFDFITTEDYEKGKTDLTYLERRDMLMSSNIDTEYIEYGKDINNREELDEYLYAVVKMGYEGLVGYSPTFKWADTTSRRVHFFKYKKRPTADLLCIAVKEGNDKYIGMIGSLLCVDKLGREVWVGSGMSDKDREQDPDYFINKVVEIEYEQIVHTYIQATHPPLNEGVLIRHDKTKKDIS